MTTMRSCKKRSWRSPSLSSCRHINGKHGIKESNDWENVATFCGQEARAVCAFHVTILHLQPGWLRTCMHAYCWHTCGEVSKRRRWGKWPMARARNGIPISLPAMTTSYLLRLCLDCIFHEKITVAIWRMWGKKIIRKCNHGKWRNFSTKNRNPNKA